MNEFGFDTVETPQPGPVVAASAACEVSVLRRDDLSYSDLSAAAALYKRAGQSLAAHRIASPRPTIFLLCNFVYHKRSNETWDQFRGKTTQCDILYPLIEEILAVYGGDVRIR